jgi:hypothetical protein
MKLFRPPPYPVILVAAVAAGVMAARWVADQEIAAARLAAERAAPPDAVDDADTTEFAAPAFEDEPAPAPDGEPGDDWDADAEWEGELAFRVLSDQGAFDVEEIDIPFTEIEADAEPAPQLEFAQVRVGQQSEETVVEEAAAAPDFDVPAADGDQPDRRHDELAALPRQALFEMAKELGVPMKDLIVMDSEQLIEAIEQAQRDGVRSPG